MKNKKIFIAPYSRTSDALCKKIEKDNEFLGFIDKVQVGENIFKLEDIGDEFDLILIYSPNHFEGIYKDLKTKIPIKKIKKVELRDGEYKYLCHHQLLVKRFFGLFDGFKKVLFKYLALFLDKIAYERKNIVFISKTFVGGNNKFLYFALCENGDNPTLLTQNKEQLNELKKNSLKALYLKSLKAHITLAYAKWIVVDQGDNNELLYLASPKQKTMQLWHGVPLEHMNLLTNITYDVFISTSDFVSKTGFKKVFLSKEFLDLGYPRNDVILAKNHSKNELLFTDVKLYSLAKNAKDENKKIIVYMPTFRESVEASQAEQSLSMGLDFASLDEFLSSHNAYLFLKLHPLVSKEVKLQGFSNIFLHQSKGDIYPILKYTDILVSDYSSVYYDFLLTKKPLVFYLYDHGKCSKMSHGYIYEFDEYSPGEKAYNQAQLQEVLAKILSKTDDFVSQRKELKDRVFTYQDEFSSKRIMEVLEK